MSERGKALQRPDWFQVALTSMGDAVILTDEHGRVTFMNPVAESLTGWAQGEASGSPLETVFRIIDEESRHPVESLAGRVLRGGVVVGLARPTLLIARDGTEWPVDDTAAPIRDADGGVCGVVLVFRDIGDRRRMERLIADAWSYAESIVATVREPLLVLDDHLRVKSASRAFYQTFHVAPEETENRFLAELGAGQWDIPALRTVLEAVLPGNTSFQDFEVACTFPALGQRTMLLSGRRLSQPGKHRGMILLAVDDVTERKRAEEALKEADRHKDEFLAMLAHELRNPLAPIRNVLHLLRLRGEAGAEEVRQGHAVIERQIEHLVRLVDDLLDVSRIARGKMQLHKEQMDLTAAVASAVEGSRPLLDARRHTLEVTLPGSPVLVDADPVRLAQVLGNLLNNAAKYTPAGGRIRLSAEVTAGGGEAAAATRLPSEVVIRVRDTGMGIPAALLPRVFDLFTQGERTLDRAEGGLGLGLTLVRRLIEMHGGTVAAFSDGPDLGSEFVVRLPALPAPSPDGRPREPAAGADTGPPAGGHRILVVDDSRDGAESLAALLRHFGNDVRTVHDGRLALEVAAAYGPDVVLLDIGLPGMDGLEVCRLLRQRPEQGQPLIVAVTGYGQEEDRRRSREAGCNAHLVKPVDPEALQALLAHP